jgi:biotin transport system substrate-specific component
MQVTAGTAPTLIDTIWPRQSGGLLRMGLLAVAGSILMALSARIQVPMWPVPMTMQTFAVLVIAMSFGCRLAGATLLLYLAEGAVGLPVFAGGGGIAYFAGPTTGYLIGFLVAATLVGWLGEKGWDRSVPLTFVAMFVGTGVIFVLGVAWLAVFLDNFQAALANGFSPFIIGAFIKIALAAAVLPLVWKLAIRKRGV